MNATSAKPLQGTRILIAEDNSLLAYDVAILLRDAGAEAVGPAMTLKRALALAEAGDFNCGVLDVSLGSEYVFPAALVLRKKGAGIVFYTGYGDMEGLKREWPDAQVLSKPAPYGFLLSAVHTACCSPPHTTLH